MSNFEHNEELIVGLYDRGVGVAPNDKIFDIGVSKILKSKIWSPYLVNMRPALSIDYLAAMAVEKQQRIKKLMLGSMCLSLDGIQKVRPFQHIYGEPEAGTPLASALSAEGGYSLLWKRVVAKPGYGTHQLLEGVHHPGEKVAQIDDVVTLGTTKREADEFLKACDLKTADVAVFVNREQGGQAALESMGLHLDSALTATAIFDALHINRRLTTTEHDFLIDYTTNPAPFEEPADHPWKNAA